MTITVVLNNEAAEIVERQLLEGRFPDAESAVTAALALLEDTSLDWSEVDAVAVQRMIADADVEGGALSREDVSQQLDLVIETAQRR